MTHDQITAEAQRIQWAIEDIQGRVQALQDAAANVCAAAERDALTAGDAGIEKAYMALAAFT